MAGTTRVASPTALYTNVDMETLVITLVAITTLFAAHSDRERSQIPETAQARAHSFECFV